MKIKTENSHLVGFSFPKTPKIEPIRVTGDG